ncbi:unnamed protein product [Urochloa humidicola]
MAGEPSPTPAGAATEAEAERLLTLSESELSAGCIRAARKNARRGALLDPASRRAAALQLRRPLAPDDYSASPLSASALRRHFKSLAESLRVDASPAILDADGEEIEMGKPSLKKKRGSGGGGKSGEHGGKPASLDRSGSKVLDGRRGKARPPSTDPRAAAVSAATTPWGASHHKVHSRPRYTGGRRPGTGRPSAALVVPTRPHQHSMYDLPRAPAAVEEGAREGAAQSRGSPAVGAKEGMAGPAACWRGTGGGGRAGWRSGRWRREACAAEAGACTMREGEGGR